MTTYKHIRIRRRSKYRQITFCLCLMLSFGFAVSERLREARITRVVVEVIALETPTPTNTPTSTPTPTATPTPSLPADREEIRQHIVEVFGDHSEKAFKVLSCENGSLNPKAVNVNKDGSRDLGVFQVNTFWHGFSKDVNNERYLFDYRINIAIAWRIYEGSGYSFNLWTCGKKFGI